MLSRLSYRMLYIIDIKFSLIICDIALQFSAGLKTVQEKQDVPKTKKDKKKEQMEQRNTKESRKNKI